MVPLRLDILSLNVAKPRVLGEKDGAPVVSAIDKRPVSAATVIVRELNVDGDAQAFLEKHGGPDKAVYAYPASNWEWWEKEHAFPCRPGAFGENLTVDGADETTIRIGDRFAWGETVLEVAQPRVPCWRLQFYSGREDIGARFTASGRCGWYFRVLATGSAPVRDAALTLIARGDAPTVREAFFAVFDSRISCAQRQAIGQVPALAEAWRKRLRTDAS